MHVFEGKNTSPTPTTQSPKNTAGRKRHTFLFKFMQNGDYSSRKPELMAGAFLKIS
jgi:hypothetical protein